MKFIDPLLKILSATAIGDRAIRPFIVVLLSSRSPLAVVGRVSEVVVLAVKGMVLRRAFAHISQKVFKLIPSITQFNAAFAVIRITLVSRIVTPTAYRFPNSIFGDFMGHPVLACSGSKSNFPQTSAVRAVTAGQIFAPNSSPLPTLAIAEPHLPVVARVSQMAHYKQRAKALIDQAFRSRTRFAERNSFDIFNVSQDGFASFAKSLRLGLASRYNALSACSYFITPQSVIQHNFLGLNPSVETPY